LLRKNEWVARFSKCKFFAKEVEFLGHILKDGQRKPAPGKLLAVEKWELPQTITGLRAFCGFANHYSSYIGKFSELAAPLQDKLRVNRVEGKAGSKVPVKWDDESRKAFEEVKKALLKGLSLQVVDPNRPFILKVDASGRSIGAVLEQLPLGEVELTTDKAMQGKTIPVAFMSRKLTPSQHRTWDIRDKEAYAVVSALQKWAGWIGLQPVLVLTDHKALESWATETLADPSGPSSRRARWHQKLSKFLLNVAYVPGKQHLPADCMSRWAYPASQSFADVSWHGSEEDDQKMHEILEEEKNSERACMVVGVHDNGKVVDFEFSRDIFGEEKNIFPIGEEGNEEEEGGGPENFSGQNFSPKNPEIQEGEEENVSNEPVMQRDWSKYYERCAYFKDTWSEIHQPHTENWPENFQFLENRLFFKGLLCIPAGITSFLIREHHAHAGHVGGERLWNEMAKRFHFSPLVGAKELTLKISKECEIFQAHSPPPFFFEGTFASYNHSPIFGGKRFD
jgi:hypothetical protein